MSLAQHKRVGCQRDMADRQKLALAKTIRNSGQNVFHATGFLVWIW